MSETIFSQVNYTLGHLVGQIELGVIGLPDMQRPFVWKNSKVRDLFDSMYRGYPVGYLLLWRNSLADDRAIGVENKQKVPSLVIVDGQQRLTSLFAVLKGLPVQRENFEADRIRIAFNPIEEKFEVTDAAIQRDKSFLPDISEMWSSGTSLFAVANAYIEGLKTTREVTDAEVACIQKSLTKLQGLNGFPFTALELAPDLSEEAVSDVFVRINSKGTPLNQSDFILTLMSVFWDEGRSQLENFCRAARKPGKGQASPFNHFIEPSPDQLLRVSVGTAFKRARLRYVYSILRGKDLKTETFSEERRIEQFAILQDAQERTLDLQNWHDFLACIRQAGFRSGKMISSQNNLLFSYILYLVGRVEAGVKPFELRKAIAQWFFMSAVTGRFTGSPESAMEFDLVPFRESRTPDEFIARLRQVCDVTLTNDFWEVTLPNDLATSSPRSPSLFAYNAALVLLDAPALFSDSKVSYLLDPSIHAVKSAVERHHLFPKGWLAKQQLTSPRDTNQIANYALVEWSDNVRISDDPPSVYVPELAKRFSGDALQEMYRLHALPEGWEAMSYSAFLVKRRELMASVIREAYQSLSEGKTSESVLLNVAEPDGILENESVEFKSTLRRNLHTGQDDKRMEMAVLKTLAGFLNTAGGSLYIGVSDDGSPVGIDADGFPNEDKMSLHFVNIVNSRLGPTTMPSIRLHFEDREGVRILVARCQPSKSPVFLKEGDAEKFFIRTGPSTTELSTSQSLEYIRKRFGN